MHSVHISSSKQHFVTVSDKLRGDRLAVFHCCWWQVQYHWPTVLNRHVQFVCASNKSHGPVGEKHQKQIQFCQNMVCIRVTLHIYTQDSDNSGT